MPTLWVDRLRVALGGRVVVGIDEMALEGPAWIGIIGANGSGKTTLLRALGGRLPAEAGEIAIDGAALGRDRAARALGIGFAPEIAALPGELTGRDILTLVARPTGATIDDPGLAPLRDALGLDAFQDRRVGTWSAGMRQRLAVYAAFVGGQKIVLLDEPFNWLDPVSAFDARRAMRDLAGRSHLIVTALHDVATFVHNCDQGFLLADGRVGLELGAGAIARGREDFRGFEQALIAQLRPSSAP
jgi:ABC-2 type transport system ATP-binding protein